MNYDIFGGRIITAQKDRIAVAGFCDRARVNECNARLRELEHLVFDTDDPTEIDAVIAAKLTELYSGAALVVGATIYIERISQRVYRTGGVLGRPEQESEDADQALEQLDSGIWMYTIPGGPGWVGMFSLEQAECLARETVNDSVQYPAKVNAIYRDLMRRSPEGYLFVSDGTGYDSFGLCTAKSGENELCFIV